MVLSLRPTKVNFFWYNLKLTLTQEIAWQHGVIVFLGWAGYYGKIALGVDRYPFFLIPRSPLPLPRDGIHARRRHGQPHEFLRHSRLEFYSIIFAVKINRRCFTGKKLIVFNNNFHRNIFEDSQKCCTVNAPSLSQNPRSRFPKLTSQSLRER